MQQSPLVNMSQQSPKNISGEPLRFSMRFIQHPIGLEHHLRTYSGSKQQAVSLVERDARLLSLLYLSTLKCHVIYHTWNGGDQQRLYLTLPHTSSWSPHGVFMDSMMTPHRIHEDSVKTPWRSHVDSMRTLRKLLLYSMELSCLAIANTLFLSKCLAPF